MFMITCCSKNQSLSVQSVLSVTTTANVLQMLCHFPLPANVPGFNPPHRQFALSLPRHQQPVLTRRAAFLDGDAVTVRNVTDFNILLCHMFVPILSVPAQSRGPSLSTPVATSFCGDRCDRDR